MTNENQKNESLIDAIPIPEESILLDFDKCVGEAELAYLAIQTLADKYKLKVSISPIDKLRKDFRIININNFLVQVVITGFDSETISIPLEPWTERRIAPQITLAAQIDDENNIVFIRGVLTNPEIKHLIPKFVLNKDQFVMPLKNFLGGASKFLRYVRILDSNSISTEPLKEKKSFIKGSESTLTLLRDQFSKRWDTVDGWINVQSLPIVESSRSNTSINKNVTLITPVFTLEKGSNIAIAKVSFDRPLIFSPDPLNEIAILKNGILLYRDRASSEKPILGLIPWPIEPIKVGEQYELLLRSENALASEFSKINIIAEDSVNLQSFDLLLDSLGSDEFRWLEIVNDKLKNDRQLGLALLFSNRAPNLESFELLKSKIWKVIGSP
ncbi:hypothetical protein [Prochlorococcus sp. MIT 0916]|uniref:hypothetical protein n=1 Tax=Prochlorococcus sp. MIT 0916 TaxID=3082521 RepID=UPI0039B5CD12